MQSNSSDNCVDPNNVEILNILDPQLNWFTLNHWQNKSEEFKNELNNFISSKDIILRKNFRNIFHSSAKLIDSSSDIDETFKCMHQNIMTEVKKYACED